MKKIVALFVMCMCVCTISGCTTNSTEKDKKDEKKVSDIQQKDIDIANELATAADNMAKLESLHMVATTQGGDVYDINISGTNYAGTQTHMITVNGVAQQTTDYVYEKDGVEATYITYAGKVMPYSNNFGPYMISTMNSDATSYKENISTEPQEDYASIFDVVDNGDGTKTITTKNEDVHTYTVNADLQITQYTDHFGQTFTADGFNAVTLDYSYSGL